MGFFLGVGSSLVGFSGLVTSWPSGRVWDGKPTSDASSLTTLPEALDTSLSNEGQVD